MNSIAPLIADRKRQAVSSLKGYDYQIWRTVEAWLRLKEDEVLYLECAEDFDLIGPESATVVQVKSSACNITLASEDALNAIENFWNLTERNHGHRCITMHFLTRGDIGLERERPFGVGKGLHLWQSAASGDDAAVEKLRSYLQGRLELPATLREFIVNKSATELREKLFARIIWCTGQPSTDAVRESVEEITVRLAREKGIGAAFAKWAVRGFLEHCREAATYGDVERRKLSVERREIVFAEATNIPVPPTSAFLNLLQVQHHSVSSADHLERFVEALSAELTARPSSPDGVALKPISHALSDAVASIVRAVQDGVWKSTAVQGARDRSYTFRRAMVVELVEAWRKQYRVELADQRLIVYDGHLYVAAREPDTGAISSRAVWARATVSERLRYTPKTGEQIRLTAKTDPDRVSSLRWDLDIKVEGGECWTVSSLRNSFFWFPSRTDRFYERKHFFDYMHVIEKLHEGWEPVGFVSFNVGEGALPEPVHPESLSMVCRIGAAEFSEMLARGTKIALAYSMSDELKLPLIFTEEFFSAALDEDAIRNSMRSIATSLRCEDYPRCVRGDIVAPLDNWRGIRLAYGNGCLWFEASHTARR